MEANEQKINISKEELNKKIKEAKQRIKEGEISITAPDSRHMKTSNNGTDISHNVQISVDNKADIVIAVNVTSNPADQGQLVKWL